MSDYYVPSIKTSAQAPYETRASDARMSKKPHERVHYNKSRKDGLESDNNEEDETTSISINALILFIENYIAEGKDNFEYPLHQEIKKESYLAPWMYQNYSNSNNAHIQTNQAVNAYKHAAKANKNTYPPATTPHNEFSADNNTLHMLLRDLKVLHNNGLHTLNVSKKSAFLESVFTAVEKEKLEI